MPVEKKNWPLISYVADTWTNVVSEVSTVASVIFCNVGTGDVVIEMRVDNGSGVKVVTVLPPTIVAANESNSLDMNSLNITGTQRLQIRATAAGAEFLASGVI